MQTYDQNGEIENEIVWMQLKAAENLQEYELKGEDCFSYPITTRDLRLWTGSVLPVYLILYDARFDEGYWINVNESVAKRIHVPRSNILGAQTIRLMQEHKNTLVESLHSKSKRPSSWKKKR